MMGARPEPGLLGCLGRLMTRDGIPRGPVWRPAADFRRTLARQFDAMIVRLRSASRGSIVTILTHVLRHHPELWLELSWSRALAALVLGPAGRSRLTVLKRRLAETKH